MLNVKIHAFKYANTPVLKAIDFKLLRGEHISILGESGCGKSTLLELIYGTLQLKDGEIFWGNKKLLGPDFNLVPGEQFIKYVSQDFNLMPYTTVEDNIGKHLSRLDMSFRKHRIAELLEVVEMTAYKTKKVKTLSGGQQQRVALARALAKEPELLLLDEPFSHIDNFRKNKLRRRLYSYLKQNYISCITATHVSEEALSFSDRILVMREGKFVAQDTPEKIYKTSQDIYVCSFFDDAFKFEDCIYYPYQITVEETGKHKAVVKHSYFKGDFWLVEATFNEDNFLLKHNTAIPAGTVILVNFNAR
jgi:ABC-type Fe3+/spermidine/putrescine transport system ATPase subunit